MKLKLVSANKIGVDGTLNGGIAHDFNKLARCNGREYSH